MNRSFCASPSSLVGYLRSGFVCTLLICALTKPLLAAEDTPVFEIKAASFELDERMLLLDSVISIELPDYITTAIDQGFAVPLSFEVEIRESRKYWFDKKNVSLKLHQKLWQLTYQVVVIHGLVNSWLMMETQFLVDSSVRKSSTY